MRPVPTRESRRGIGPDRLRYLALFALACFFLMPVYVLLVTAFKDPARGQRRQMWELPRHASRWTASARSGRSCEDGFVNSLLLAVPASLISSLLGAANGFVLSKWRFPGADFVFPLILFGMFIPYQAVLIPMFRADDRRRPATAGWPG